MRRRSRKAFARDDDDDDRPPRREAAADFPGRPIGGSSFKQNGRKRYVADFRDPAESDCNEPLEEPRLDELKRRLAKRLAQYRASGEFSHLELEIIAGTFDWQSMDAIGLRLEMSRQGVWYHVQRILPRAGLFRKFWIYKHKMKARK